MSNLSLRFAARSEIGKVRKNNEDSGYASKDLLVVADGMGGHEAGELASAATISAVVNASDDNSDVDTVLGHLADAVITSGEYIADVVARNREFAGMGTTMTALALRDDRVAIAHVGDSRAYILREGELQQLTKDHTFVQTLVDSGQISREQAAVHPRRNLMMRAIDGIHAVEVDLSVREARPGDRFMLCSDGLCGVLDEATIAEMLSTSELASAVTALIDAALDAGGPDNVTVLVADVVEVNDNLDAVVIGAAAESETQERLPGVVLPEEAQYITTHLHGIPPAQRRWLTTVLVTAVLVLLGAIAGGSWLTAQWFIGVDQQSGSVAIFQGIPVSGLSREVIVSDVKVSQLPEFERIQVQSTIGASSLTDAQATVEQLDARALACKTAPTTPGCPAVPQ